MGSRYIVNGKVERSDIAIDIRYRDLSHDGIVELCNNPQVQEGFIGSDFSDKRPKQEWNKDYLHELSYAAIAESFNLDYLLYLDEVAEFVAKKATFKKVVIAGVVVVLVIVAGVVVYKYAVGAAAVKAGSAAVKAVAFGGVV